MGRSGGLKISQRKVSLRSNLSFKTGFETASSKPDPNDPLVYGYPTPTKEELEEARDSIKARHRLAEPLSANDQDIISKELNSKTREIQYRNYRLKKEAQRKQLAKESGRVLDAKKPTAAEYGAQYDLAPETVADRIDIQLKDQEKARLPNGEAVIGPANISVSFSDGQMITVVTSSLNQNPLVENYYQNETRALPKEEIEAIRNKWLMKRANILYKDSIGKKPLNEEEAKFRAEREFADKIKTEEGFNEDFDEFVSKKSKELMTKTRNNQELSLDQAQEAAKKELSRIDRLGGLKFKIEVRTNLKNNKNERFPFPTKKDASIENLTVTPSCFTGLDNE